MKKQNLKIKEVQDSQTHPQLRLRAKLIWFSIPRGRVTFVEMHLVLLFSYLQIFFISTRFIRKFGVDDYSSLSKGFRYIEDAFTLDNLFGYSSRDNGLFAAFALILAYFVVAIVTPFLLIRSIRAHIPPNKLVTALWGILIRFHNPIVFLLIHDITGRVQEEYSQDNFNAFSSSTLNQVFFILSLVFSALNLVLSILRTIFLHDFIPKKNLMSSKNSYPDQISLIQKIVIPVLHRFMIVDTISTVVIILINTSLCLLKIYKYYSTYPRYNLKALQFNAHMITIEASIVLFTPILFILNSIKTIEITITEALFMVIMILPFMLFWTQQILNRGLTNIIYSPPDQINPHKLIHRLILLKQMKSQKGKYDEVNGNMNVNKLYFATLATHVSNCFGETDEELLAMDFNDKTVQNKIIRLFLERLEKAHPHDNLLKLSLIKFYSKTLKLFSLAISNLSVFHSLSPRMKVSKDLLYLEIQDSISTYYKGNNDSINMAEYLTNMNRIETFKKKISIQLNLQKQFWEEYNKVSPDGFTLYKLSKKVELQRKIVTSHWNRTDFDKEYSQPFLLYASYLLVLNDSLHEGIRYIRSYNLFNPRVKETIGHEFMGLSSETLYSDETFYVTIKTDGDSVGHIQKCSQSIKRILNYDAEAMIGQNINNLMSDYIAQGHDELLLKYVRTGETKILNYVRSIFVKDSEGFLHRGSIFSKVHPFFSQELYVTGLIRPLKSHEEYMIITPQGLIDSTSRDIGTVLDVNGKRIMLSTVCREFEELNEIFNYFGYRQIKPNAQGGLHFGAISLKFKERHDEEAIDPRMEALYNKWVIDGGELKFSLPSTDYKHHHNNNKNHSQRSSHRKRTNNFITFWCKIYNYWFANDFLKIIVIQRANHLQDEYLQLLENNPDIKFIKKPVVPEKPKGKKSCDFSEIDEIEEFKKHVKYNIVHTTEATSPPRMNSSKQVEGPMSLHHIKGLDSSKHIKGLDSSKHIKGMESSKRLGLPSLESCRDDFALLKGLLSPKGSAGSKNWQLKKQDDKETHTHSTSRDVEMEIKARPVSVTSTSQATNIAREGRLHNEINKVLKKRDYPQSALVFIGVCFCLGIMIFCLQVYVGKTVHNELQGLRALGQTIDLANTAVDALLIINRGARISLEEIFGLVDTENNTLAALYMQSFESNMIKYMPILRDTNNGLYSSIQKNNDKFVELFTTEDIRFYDFNTSLEIEVERNVDSITGIVLILNRLYALRGNHSLTGKYNPVDLMYIMRNGCGDLLVQNKNLAELGGEHIHNSISNQHDILNVVFGISLGMLVIKLMTAFYFCYKFYSLELSKLRFFLRIKENEFKWIKERLQLLEGALKNEDYNEIIQTHGYVKLDLNYNAKGTYLGGKTAAKHAFKDPAMKSILRKYLVKIGVWVIILAIYAILISIIYSVVYNQGSEFESGMNRLLTLQNFLENVQLSIVGFYALFLPDHDPTIENIPILEALETNLDILAQSTPILTNAYKKGDGSIESEILPIFNGNVCNFVPEEDVDKCVFATSGLGSINIFTLISALHSRLQYFSEQYLGSDQTFGDAKQTCTDGFVDITPFSVTIRNVLVFMITEARKNFEDIYDSLERKLVTYLIIKIVMFWILFSLSWRYVIKYMINCPNRIKSMMMIVPVNLLITNKPLKALLLKACKGNHTILKADMN